MVVQKVRYIRTYVVVDGEGIFDTITNIVKNITGNTVGNLASKEAGKVHCSTCDATYITYNNTCTSDAVTSLARADCR